jgi:DnaK suppressor protein
MKSQDPTHLVPSERASVRALLEKLLADLEPRVAQLAESARPVDLDEPIGRLSRMDALQSQEMAKSGLTRIRHRLELVRRALRRIDDLDFGACGTCGEPIGIDRLEFEPETTQCVRCA